MRNNPFDKWNSHSTGLGRADDEVAYYNSCIHFGDEYLFCGDITETRLNKIRTVTRGNFSPLVIINEHGSVMAVANDGKVFDVDVINERKPKFEFDETRPLFNLFED